jgi:hypothetical protein
MKQNKNGGRKAEVQKCRKFEIQKGRKTEKQKE